MVGLDFFDICQSFVKKHKKAIIYTWKGLNKFQNGV